MRKRRKRTPEERAALAELDERSAANLARLRELVERGFTELREKRAAAERGEIVLDPAWRPPPG